MFIKARTPAFGTNSECLINTACISKLSITETINHEYLVSAKTIDGETVIIPTYDPTNYGAAKITERITASAAELFKNCDPQISILDTSSTECAAFVFRWLKCCEYNNPHCDIQDFDIFVHATNNSKIQVEKIIEQIFHKLTIA